MNLITIMVERSSVEGLSAALPTAGVSSVTICEVYRGAGAAAVSAGLLGAPTAAKSAGQLVNA